MPGRANRPGGTIINLITAVVLFGLLALAAFYAVLYTFGSFDPEEESWVLRIGKAAIWREYAVLFALPVSALSFLAGHILGRPGPSGRKEP